jgi:hypothetical protein
MDNSVQIQLQDISGNWRTWQIIINYSQDVISEMRQLQSHYPDQRVRAVDMNGRIVDIL